MTSSLERVVSHEHLQDRKGTSAIDESDEITSKVEAQASCLAVTNFVTKLRSVRFMGARRP